MIEGSAESTVVILGIVLDAEYDYKITYKGYPEIAPSMNDPGAPAEPPEFEITMACLRQGEKVIDVPPWLATLIEIHLHDSNQVYETIKEAIWRR